MNPSSVTDEKLVALIITCMRYGIEKDELIQHFRCAIPDPVHRKRSFVQALEINDEMEANNAKGVIAVSVIVEYVKQYFKNLNEGDENNGKMKESQKTATVIRLYRMASESETSLNRLGEQVIVLEEDESALWVFIEKSDSHEAGWVPRDTLSYNDIS